MYDKPVSLNSSNLIVRPELELFRVAGNVLDDASKPEMRVLSAQDSSDGFGVGFAKVDFFPNNIEHQLRPRGRVVLAQFARDLSELLKWNLVNFPQDAQRSKADHISKRINSAKSIAPIFGCIIRLEKLGPIPIAELSVR